MRPLKLSTKPFCIGLPPSDGLQANHCRAAGRDVVLIYLAVFLPLQGRIRSQFGSIIADHHAGVTTHLSDPIEFTRNTVNRQIRIDHSRKTFAALVINHIQNAVHAATRQAVRHKVQAPISQLFARH